MLPRSEKLMKVILLRMASSFQETVSDFDLNFLDITNDSLVPLSKYEKQRKAVLCVKKKTIATTYLIQKFYDKKELLEHREKQLLVTKEECRQLSIKFKDAEDRNEQLQRENTLLQDENKEILGKSIEKENQYEAMRSYCNQLQILAKDNETRIQSMTLESNLEKSDTKVSQKKVTTLQKENEELVKHIIMLSEVVLGARKATKKDISVLDKYQKLGRRKLEILTEDEDSVHDVFEEVPESTAYESASDIEETTQSRLTPVINTDAVETVPDESDRDSGSGTEVTSNDTGRGSSLAFSGSDKCLPSPDYFSNDSPISPENEKSKLKTTQANAATSPMKPCSTVDKSGSPIAFDKMNENISSQIRNAPIADVATSPIKRLTSNKSTSPIEFNNNKPEQHNSTVIMQSPPKIQSHELVLSPIEDMNEKTNGEVLPSIPSDVSDDDQDVNEDSEIEMIFTNMRMSHKLITPIPMTPCKSRCTDIRSGCNILPERPRGHCPDAAKIREENYVFHSKLSDLAKEVKCIKSLLINKMHDDNKRNYDVPVRNNTKNPQNQYCPLYERDLSTNDDTQMDNNVETIILSNESSNSNSAMEQESNKLDDNVHTPISQSLIINVFEETSSRASKETNLHGIVNGNNSIQVGINNRTKSTAILFGNDTESNDSAPQELSQQHDSINNRTKSTAILFGNYTESNDSAPQELSQQHDSINYRTKSTAILFGNDIESNDSAPQELSQQHDSINNRTKSTAILFENDTESNDSAPEELSEQHDSESLVPSAANESALRSRNRAKRPRKLTRLQRIKKHLIPRNKIRSALPTPKRLGGKSRVLVSRKTSKVQSSNLNNKAAYEKAVKVMNELRNKEKDKAVVRHVRTMIPKTGLSSSNKKNEASKDPPVDINTEICEDNESGTNMPRRSSITTRSHNSNNQEGTSHGVKLKVDHPQVVGNTNILKDLKPCTVTATLLGSDYVRDKAKVTVIPNSNGRIDSTVVDQSSPKPSITTRSRHAQKKSALEVKTDGSEKKQADSIAKDLPLPDSRHRRKRSSVDMLVEHNKRVLRSSGTQNDVEQQPVISPTKLEKKITTDTRKPEAGKEAEKYESGILKMPKDSNHNRLTCYDDLDMFGGTDIQPNKKPRLSNSKSIENPQSSVLCAMLDKYAVVKMKNIPPKTAPDSVITSLKQKIENAVARIVELPTEQTKPAMNKFVEEIKCWELKDFMSGLLKYLTDPVRKDELLSKRYVMNSPAMTKSEQVLLYVFAQIKDFWPNIHFMNYVLDNIQFTLFRLNKTPEFETIDSLSHFYAVLCRYIKAKNRLRLFMMDAMYCMQFKAVPLIRQCLDVWMHILPLAHMGIAKSPLVTCLVYLLHFYKCEDRYNRVQDIRNILNRSYSYQITDWNEPKILDMFRTAIRDHKDVPVEKKMLRMALIIIAKRHGPRWCDKNIIKGVLQSIIDDDIASERAKLFCVSMMGPLMKPYPVDMKVNVEVVVTQLLEIFDHSASSQPMKEAVITSLLFISKHCQTRVLQALLKWRPDKLSPDLESLLRDFVRTKPMKGWEILLSKTSLDDC